MGTQINIMGLEVDIIGTDTLVAKVKGYLESDVLNIILFATTNLIDHTIEDEELKNLVLEADYILPGEETLLSLHHVDTLKIASMVVDYESLAYAFQNIDLKSTTMYLIAANEKEATAYTNFIRDNYPDIQVLGAFYDDLLQNQELVINEINSITPDMLLFVIDTPLQERFIMENKSKLNAKLCIGLGRIDVEASMKQKQAKKVFKNKTLEYLYYFFIENKGIKKILDTRIFKRKVENYKNKRGGKTHGDNE